MLAGLLQNDLATAQEQLPWLGDVPVLGALFSSKSYQKNETDLIIIVTPRIVQPTRPGDVVRTPLDNTLPANDVDFFLKNKNEVLRTEVRGGGAQVERGPIGHMLELPKGGDHVVLQSKRLGPARPSCCCGSLLAGCSDIYYDRRETVSFAANDAVASAQATQTIDPWPPASANRNIASNGAARRRRDRALPHRPDHPAQGHEHRRPATPPKRSRRRAAAAAVDLGRRVVGDMTAAGAGAALTPGYELAMRNNRSKAASNKTNVLVLTADAEFEQLVRATFTAAAQIELSVLHRHARRQRG